MNKTLIAAAMYDDVRLIAINYHGSGSKRYTFKTRDMSIKLGDHVVVPRFFEDDINLDMDQDDPRRKEIKHGFSSGVVVELDPDVNYQECAIKYRWIVGKIDTTNYDSIIAWENALMTEVKQIERKRRRENMQAAVVAEFGQLPDLSKVNKND